jgi:hypothetical protein
MKKTMKRKKKRKKRKRKKKRKKVMASFLHLEEVEAPVLEERPTGLRAPPEEVEAPVLEERPTGLRAPPEEVEVLVSEAEVLILEVAPLAPGSEALAAGVRPLYFRVTGTVLITEVAEVEVGEEEEVLEEVLEVKKPEEVINELALFLIYDVSDF